jgi:glycosyltransferase involved in cell wall biosynthesis
VTADGASTSAVGADPFLHAYYARFSPPVARREDAPLRLAFLVGSLDISGGTYVILQHALHAQHHGADVTLLVQFRSDAESLRWHPALRELLIIHLDELVDDLVDELEFDVAIATFWRTVYELPQVRSRHYAYLVQSIESRFYGGSEDQDVVPIVELTYTFDLPIITIARWMQAYLAFRHERPAFLVRNGVRKDVYSPVGPRADATPGRFRVLLEGAVDVPMKNIETSVRVSRDAGADEVWLLTPSDVRSMPGVDRVFSRIPIDETAVIYRSCPVLLKLSLVEGMYGPPLEMFHCGGTVVTNDVTGHDEYVRNDENGLVVPMHDDAAAVAALARLKNEPETLARLRAGALQTARAWPDWDHSSDDFLEVVRIVARQPARDHVATLLAIRGAALDLGG